MTFEQHAQTRLGYQSDMDLQSFTNGHGIGDAGLANSPLPDQRLQELAEEELAMREEERKAAIAQLEESQLGDDPLDDL